MNFIDTNAITKLSSTASVDLNGGAGTETVLYTVPAGFKAIIDSVVIHTLSASCASAVITLGVGGGSADEFLGDQTLTNLDGTTKTAKLTIVPNATPVDSVILTAGQTFVVEITTAHGSAVTATFDLFGYLISA